MNWAKNFKGSGYRLAILCAAFDATTKDAQFLAKTEKLELPVVGPILGSEAEQIVASIYAASPGMIARAQAIVGQYATADEILCSCVKIPCSFSEIPSSDE